MRLEKYATAIFVFLLLSTAVFAAPNFGHSANDITGGTMAGNLTVTGSVSSNQVCINGDCKTEWPAAATSVNYSDISDVNGNVGIGTTEPTAKLDVAGDMKASSVDAPKVCINGVCKTEWPSASVSGLAPDANGNLNINTGMIYLNSTVVSAGPVGNNYFQWHSHNLWMGTGEGDYASNYLNLRPGGAAQGELYSTLNMFDANSVGDYEQKVSITSTGNSYFTGGNIGIGTNSPQDLLQLSRNDGHNPTIVLTRADAGADQKSWRMIGTGDTFRIGTVNDGYTASNDNILVVKRNGDVGIGIDSPTAKLDVRGSPRIAGHILITDALQNAVFVINDNSSRGFVFRKAANIDTYDGANNMADLMEITPSGNVVVAGDVNAKKLCIDGDCRSAWPAATVASLAPDASGNVGIGTANPRAELDVAGGIRAKKGDTIGTNDVSNVGFSFEDDGDTGMFAVGGNSFSSSDLIFKSDTVERMRVTYGGNVGIGTTSPQGKLDVKTDDGLGQILIKNNAGGLTASSKSVIINGPLYGVSGGNMPPNVVGATFFEIGGTHHNGEVVPSQFNAGSVALRVNTIGPGNRYSSALSFRTVGDSFTNSEATEKLTLLGNGNVGIGTTTPTMNLQFGNSAYIGLPANNYAPNIPVAWKRGNAGGIIMANSQNPDGSGWAYGSRIINHDYGNGLALSFDTLSAGTWTNDVLVVSGRDGVGRVGIGTTSPTAKLDVNGNSAIARVASSTGTAFSVVYDEGGSKYVGFQQRGSAAPGNWNLGNGASELIANGGNFGIGTYVNKYLVLVTNNNERVRITEGGKVGIGTISPSAVLDVAGDVKATSFCLGTNCITSWPAGSSASTASASTFTALKEVNGNVGIGTASPTAKLDVVQNSAIKVGQAYLSSGGDYAHLANNEWYDGNAWIQTAPGAMIQLTGQNINFYKHDAAGGHTTLATINSNGDLNVVGSITASGKVNGALSSCRLVTASVSTSTHTYGGTTTTSGGFFGGYTTTTVPPSVAYCAGAEMLTGGACQVAQAGAGTASRILLDSAGKPSGYECIVSGSGSDTVTAQAICCPR